MLTVPAPETTALVSRSVGSLHDRTGSPSRAAALPLIVTDDEPWLTLPLLVGGFWNETPGGRGMCWRVVGRH